MTNTNSYSFDEINTMAEQAAGDLFTSSKIDGKLSDGKSESKELKQRAYKPLHLLFESFGLASTDNARVYKQDVQFERLREIFCNKLSALFKDKLLVTKAGDTSYSARVRKQWSRVVTTYREGTEDGTQTKADKAGKQRAAIERKYDALLAAKMIDVTTHVRDNDDISEDFIRLQAAGVEAILAEKNTALGALL